ncbi:MAG: TauD/TfdA family dioxygenase, partial [Rhodospirillaceae bacterium]|nr:TauD/TfdA family dioxygenase [Rhodospirillaceae bacterium]
MAFEVRKLTPSFGAEVLGIDLTKEITAEILADVKALWAEHQLLLFRGQSLEEKDAVAFSGQLGELEIHVRREYLSPDNPEILYVSNMKVDGKAIGILSDTEVGWHYDQIYLPRPAVGSLLCAVKLPANGGQTSFANMSAAYEALSDDIKAKIEGRK